MRERRVRSRTSSSNSPGIPDAEGILIECSSITGMTIFPYFLDNHLRSFIGREKERVSNERERREREMKGFTGRELGHPLLDLYYWTSGGRCKREEVKRMGRRGSGGSTGGKRVFKRVS